MAWRKLFGGEEQKEKPPEKPPVDSSVAETAPASSSEVPAPEVQKPVTIWGNVSSFFGFQEEKHPVGSLQYTITNVLQCIEKAYEKYPDQVKNKTAAYLYLENLKTLFSQANGAYKCLLKKSELSNADAVILMKDGFYIYPSLLKLTDCKSLLLSQISKELPNILKKIINNIPPGETVSVNHEDDFLCKVQQEILALKESLLNKDSPLGKLLAVTPMLTKTPEEFLIEITDTIVNLQLDECLLNNESSDEIRENVKNGLLLKMQNMLFDSVGARFNITASSPMLYSFFQEASKFFPATPPQIEQFLGPSTSFNPDVICIDTADFLAIPAIFGHYRIEHKKEAANPYQYNLLIFGKKNEKDKEEVHLATTEIDLNLIPQIFCSLHNRMELEIAAYASIYEAQAENKVVPPVSVHLQDTVSTKTASSTSTSTDATSVSTTTASSTSTSTVAASAGTTSADANPSTFKNR